MTFNVKKFAFAAFLGVAGILFALIGPIDMMHSGPFGWHIRQPAFWQGGIELIVLATLVGVALYALQGWYRIAVVLALCELYARWQGVDLAILITLLYYEGIAALGSLILNRLGRSELSDTQCCLFGILLGTLTWCCIEWILSALGPGSVRDLQAAALAVLGVSLLLLRRLPVLGCVFSHVGTRNRSGALLGTFMCTIVLMLFAKASVSIDYDSLWYGVRGDRVLVAAGSVFRGLGLVGPVHYAPQAYELLLVPLTRLHSVTPILGFSIWCWVGLGICLYAITERLQWYPKVRLVAVAVALATPAVMNIAITAKGDVTGATWVFFAAYAITSYRVTKHKPWLVVAFFSALIATAFRMSVFIYAGVTGILALRFLVVALLRRVRSVDRNTTLSSATWIWLSLASTVLFTLVTLRTYLLAGVPFAEISSLVNLAERVGFSMKFPVGGPAPVYPSVNGDISSLLLDFLFRPANLPHIIIGWTGAAFAYFLLIGVAIGSRRRELLRNTSILWLLAILFPLLLTFVSFPIRGGDGNYFIVPILSMVLLGVGMAGEPLCGRNALGRTLGWIAGLFVVSSVAVSLVTGSWGPGTRAWDLNFSRPVHDYKQRANFALDGASLQLVDAYLKQMPADTRVVGIAQLDSNNPLPGAWLPVRYEALQNIAWTRPGYVHSASSIQAFLLLDNIRFVLIPRDPDTAGDHVALANRTETALEDLRSRGMAKQVVYTDRFELWKLTD